MLRKTSTFIIISHLEILHLSLETDMPGVFWKSKETQLQDRLLKHLNSNTEHPELRTKNLRLY